LSSGGPNKVEVEERLEYVEEPFCFTGLDINDLAGVLALDRVRRKIPDVADRVEIIRQPTREAV
jgi:hypothetical protein